MDNKKIKILLTGGGSGGPVSPLLAMVDEVRAQKKDWEFAWIGTKKGPERAMVEKENIKFKTIYNGKLRRYFDLRNFIDPFKIFFGFLQSVFFILKWRPNLVMSAGGFVSVGVAWASWILRVPVLIHQQDVRPGLSNRLMSPFAKVITVTFEKSLNDFGEKAVLIGNPTRAQLQIKKEVNLKNDLPIILIVGGGQGATGLNKLVEDSLDKITKFCQIIHIAGKGKCKEKVIENYKCFEFLNVDEMGHTLKKVDLVVSRTGLSLLTELSALAKPAILIPMPDSHQEDNAQLFKEFDAAIVLNQKETNKEDFAKNIKNILDDENLKNKLSKNISKVIKKGGSQRMVEVIDKLII